MVEIEYNPYRNIDWGIYKRYPTAYHVHDYKQDGIRGPLKGPHEVIDKLADPEHDIIEGFEVYGMAGNPGYAADVDESIPFQSWPWTDLVNIHRLEDEPYTPSVENRDPEQMGVIAFPTVEVLGSGFNGHVCVLFGENIPQTLSTREPIGYTGWDGVVNLAHEYGALAIIAHPHRDQHRASVYFDAFKNKASLIGIEALNKQSRLGQDLKRWDDLLTHFAPNIKGIYGFSAQDCDDLWDIGGNEHGFNGGAYIRETQIVLNPNDMNAANQTASRAKVREAFEDGAIFACQRPLWDDDNADPIPYPAISSVVVDEAKQTITVDAEHYDKIHWISEGKIIHGGNVFFYGTTAMRGQYVRAHVKSDAGAETLVQPISFKGKRPAWYGKFPVYF